MKVYNFEKLEVWILSRHLNILIYEYTSKIEFRGNEYIISQIRRAANSISSNIAEGSSRSSEKERRRYLNMSYGSALELLNHLILLLDIKKIEECDYLKIRELIEEITNKINAFVKYLNNQKSKM